ncbi:hypothetical protein OK074_2963 [Actinobacteria bacterium OK074]|nr:hypothetical protein OK074_2963 [Actinobacteria bacterium OK074]
MAITKVDNAAVTATAGKLKTAVSGTLVPELQRLQTSVDNLLADGLLLAQTSPKLQASYQEFTTSITTFVNNINNFADQFQSIAGAVLDLDSNIAGQIGK